MRTAGTALTVDPLLLVPRCVLTFAVETASAMPTGGEGRGAVDPKLETCKPRVIVLRRTKQWVGDRARGRGWYGVGWGWRSSQPPSHIPALTISRLPLEWSWSASARTVEFVKEGAGCSAPESVVRLARFQPSVAMMYRSWKEKAAGRTRCGNRSRRERQVSKQMPVSRGGLGVKGGSAAEAEWNAEGICHVAGGGA